MLQHLTAEQTSQNEAGLMDGYYTTGMKSLINQSWDFDRRNKHKLKMVCGMQKKVLSEQALYYGDVAMPKDWDIDRDKLSGDILQSVIQKKEFPFSRTFDMLNTYIRDHIRLEYNFNLINKETWGNIYKPQETTIPLLKYRSSRFT